MTIQPDGEIVAAVTGGDRDAFAALVARYARSAIGIATQILRDRHAAEDVAQEAFATAYENLKSLSDENAFGPWLLQIVRRRALRVREANQRIPQFHQTSHEPFAKEPDSLNDDRQLLLMLIEQLPEHERCVVMLRYFDGDSVNDIARITGSTTGTVTKTLTRARKRLLSMVERSKS